MVNPINKFTFQRRHVMLFIFNLCRFSCLECEHAAIGIFNIKHRYMFIYVVDTRIKYNITRKLNDDYRYLTCVFIIRPRP